MKGILIPANEEKLSAPPLIQQLNNGNWLTQHEAEELRDELFYQHAVHVYMTMLPVLNTIGMRTVQKRPSARVTTSCPFGRTVWIRAHGCQRPTPMSFIR
jgi:hypothetical protein